MYRQGVRSEQPTPGSEPSYGSGLASALGQSGSSDPDRQRGREVEVQTPASAGREPRQRGVSQGTRARWLRSPGSLSRRRGRARKHTSGWAGTSVPPQSSGAGACSQASTNVAHCAQSPASTHLGGVAVGRRPQLGGSPPATAGSGQRSGERELVPPRWGEGRQAKARARFGGEGGGIPNESLRRLGRDPRATPVERGTSSRVRLAREVHWPRESGEDEASEERIERAMLWRSANDTDRARHPSGAPVPGGSRSRSGVRGEG